MAAGQPYVDTSSGDFKYQGTTGTPAIVAKADGSVHLIPLITPVAASNGQWSVGVTAFTGIGVVSFDPSALFSTNGKITRSISFTAVLEASSGVTAQIQLFNITAGSAVTGSLLSTSNNAPSIVSGVLTVGSSPNLVNSLQVYEVQLRISLPTNPAVTDRAICKMANLQVTWS